MGQLQKKWSKEEIEILHSNYNKISYEEISKLLKNRTVFQIRNKANYDGLCSNNNLRKYSVNKRFFENPNLINSYWAGFIAADGCVDDRNRLSIGLKKDDFDHLNKFVERINYTNPTKIYKDRCVVTINCKEICEDLKANYNIIPRKSNVLLPPNINDEKLVASFIKGVIDGDGSVMKKSIVIYGTKDLLEWIKVYFEKWTTSSNYQLSEVRHKQNCLFYYKVSGKRKEEIFNKLKKLNCDELNRKW